MRFLKEPTTFVALRVLAKMKTDAHICVVTTNENELVYSSWKL